MDKIQSASSSQSTPLWERQKSHKGHRSSVDGAVAAHRKRVSERQARVEERLNIARDLSTKFFPKPGVVEKPMLETEMIEINKVNEQIAQIAPSMRQLDAIYDDAQMTPVTQQALQVIEKDLANPEEAPQDDVPRGSYVDYVV